jgi:hypothetical protein
MSIILAFERCKTMPPGCRGQTYVFPRSRESPESRCPFVRTAAGGLDVLAGARIDATNSLLPKRSRLPAIFQDNLAAVISRNLTAASLVSAAHPPEPAMINYLLSLSLR